MKTPVATALRCSLMFLVSAVAYADSAQWNLNPTSGDWNTAANWTPMTVPNGPGDTATFDFSDMTNVSTSANTEVNSIIFTPVGTNPYTITTGHDATFTISGAGIVNNSGIAQNFVTNGGQFGQISFTNNATAGSSTIFINNHGTDNFLGGHTYFFNTSTAGNGTFINNSGAVGGLFQGFTEFFDTSTAGSGTFINIGSTMEEIGNGGQTAFLDTASAGEAMITNNGGAAFNAGGCLVYFAYSSTAASATIINDGGTASGAFGGVTEIGVFEDDTATAASATFIANGGTGGGAGGTISFFGNSTGGTSRIEVLGNGSLDISGHNAPGLTIGSIEGDGDVFLGANNMTVGSNNLNTTFSGVIQDGGFGTSLTMTGNRSLDLIGASPNNGNPLLGRAVLKVYDSISSNTLAIQNGSLRGSAGGSLTKIGSGTLDLEGVNTYTGDTSINRGVLQVDGSISSNTFVNWGGTLAGTGTVNGNVTNARGKISPGDAVGVPGVLTVGPNYMQTAGATLFVQIGGGSADQVSVLDVQGNANLNGFLDPVLVNGFVPEIGQSFTFLNYASFTGFFHIRNPVFDHGRQRWLLAYNPTTAVLTAVENHRP
jgi:autotransporter-associated beta strand protein